MRLPIGIPLIVRNVEITVPKSSIRVDLILDTGAELTLISRYMLEAIGYDLTTISKKLKITTAGNVIEAPKIIVEKIAIGNIETQDVEVICRDIPGLVVHGLLGLSFLKHFRTVIDYKKGYLEIS